RAAVFGKGSVKRTKGKSTSVPPRRSRKMTHICSLKATHTENTLGDTDLNLFLHCERQLFCLRHLLDKDVEFPQSIAYECIRPTTDIFVGARQIAKSGWRSLYGYTLT